MTADASAPLSRRALRAQREVGGAPHPITDDAVPTGAGSPRVKKSRPRRGATFTSVLGELLLTAGVLVLLFVAWQMWIGDRIIGAEADRVGAELSAQWAELPPPPAPEPVVEGDQVWYEPVIGQRPVGTEVFATMHIPRFGDGYMVEVAGGTTRKHTLDHARLGLYDQAAMPGEVGNFAVAGHRTTWGARLGPIDTLQLNDPIIVETPEGWYLYRFRTLEYVKPTQIEVLLEVPEMPGVQTGERYITLTACSPKHSLAERIIAYGVFDSFQPRAVGEPEWLNAGGA